MAEQARAAAADQKRLWQMEKARAEKLERKLGKARELRAANGRPLEGLESTL